MKKHKNIVEERIQEEMVGLTVTLKNKLINIVSLECARTDHRLELKHCKICMKKRRKNDS